jgi:hypothetical protein
MEVRPMHAIRGVYDGTTVHPLPSESLPDVEGEVEVEIRFPDEERGGGTVSQRRAEAAQRLLAARASTPLLDVPIWELVEDGRSRQAGSHRRVEAVRRPSPPAR